MSEVDKRCENEISISNENNPAYISEKALEIKSYLLA